MAAKRRRHDSDTFAVLRWLQIGAVTAGVGAALAAGQGVAVASPGDPGADDNTSTSQESDSNDEPDPEQDSSVADEDEEVAEPDDGPELEPGPEEEEVAPVEPALEEEDSDEPTAIEPEPESLPTEPVVSDEPAPKPEHEYEDAPADEPLPVVEPESTQRTVLEFAEPDDIAVQSPAVETFSLTTTFAALSDTTTVSPSIAPVAPEYPPQVTQTPVTWRSITADLLAWTGMGTLAADTDIPALPVNRFIEALWLDIRRIHYTWMNSYPQASSKQVWQDPATGVVVGTVNAYDADGDKLTYTVVDGPQHGEVTIVNGVYTYTPDAAFASTGGTDTFVVAIDDGPGNPWHTHGFSQVLEAVGLTGPSTTTVTVTVDGTGDPVVVGTPTSIAGAAAGSVLLTPDGTRVIQTTTNHNAATTVTIINTADGSIVGTPITVDEYAGLRPVLTPNGTQLVLSTLDVVSGETTVTVINTADGTVAGSSTFAGAYQDPAVVNSDSTRAYVVTYDGNTTAVMIVDLSDASIAGRNDQAAGGPAGAPVLSPDGSLVYQSSGFYSSGTDFTQVTIFDATNGDYVGTATFSGLPTGPVVVSPDGQHAIQTTYYAPLDKSIITVFDSNGDYVGEAQAPGTAVGDPVFSQDGSRAYQTVNRYDPGLNDFVTTIVMLDSTTGTKLDEHEVAGAVVQGLRLSKDGSTAVQTTNRIDGATVTIIDTAAGTFADVPVNGGAADGPAVISADGTRAAVLTRSTGTYGPTVTVTLINADTATPSVSSSVSGTNALGQLTQSADGTIAVALLYANGYTTPVVIDFERSSLSSSQRYQGIPTRPAGFSADGSYVAASLQYSDPGTSMSTTSLIVLRVNDGFVNAVGQPVELHRFPLGAPVLSPDGSRVIQTTETASGSRVTTVTVVDTQPVAPPPPPVDDTVTVRTVIADLLSWTGLGTLSSTAPIPNAPLPAFLQNAWRGVSDVHSTLWNSYPHAAPVQVSQDPETGVVVGTVGGVDADDDHLTYTVVDGPANGTVTIVDGVYTYTPSTAFAQAGGTDTFTVSIDDMSGNPWHRHGFSQIVQNVGITGLSRQTVTVSVTPVQIEPVIVATPGEPDPETGAVIITVAASEPGGGPVTVTAGTPVDGDLVDNTDGTWTYTPYEAVRLQASQVGAPPMSEAITFTATDDDGQTASETLDIAIEPLVNEVIGSFAVTSPWDIALSDDGMTAYLTTIAGSDDGVTIVDTATGDVITFIPLSASSTPAYLAVSPTGGPIYVANFTVPGAISVIGTDNQLGTPIPVGNNSRDVAFSPDGTTAYTANTSGSISVIDVATGDVTTLPPVAGLTPRSLVVSADGTKLYVINSAGSADKVEILNLADGTRIDTVPVAAGAFDIAMTPDGQKLVVTSADSHTVSIIDTATNAVTPVAVDGIPRPVAVSPDGITAYAAVSVTAGDDFIAVIDIASGAVVDTIAAGESNNGVAVSGDGRHLYATNTDAGTVTVVSLGSGVDAEVLT